MRVLWASHLVPYPPKSGVHLRSYNLLKGVAEKHEVDLVAFIQEQWLRVFYPSREEALEDCRRALGRLCGSVRLIEIDSLKRRGGKVRSALAGLVLPSSYSIRWLQSRNARRQFAEIAKQHSYSLAHFDTIGLAPYRALFAHSAATLGHHNIESHMLLRRAANEPSLPKRLYYLQEGMRVQRYEAQVADEFAAHITCSELDSARLRGIAPRANAVAIPNGVDVEYFRPEPSDASARSIIFVGSLNWYPNVDAVLYLLNEIWPALKAVAPDLRLDVVGSAPPRSVLDLAASLPDVTVHGFVDDVRPLMNAATIYVCPIRDGGGTELKLLDAFAMQKCVVAHPIACEGIDVVAGRQVALADSVATFVQTIQRLLQDPRGREEMGLAARQLVVERYAFADIGRRLGDLFDSLVARRERPSAPVSK